MNKEQSEQNIKRIEQELGRKTSELNSYINDLTIRMKGIEDELINEEDDGEGNLGATHVKLEKKLAATLKDLGPIQAEEDAVNIGEGDLDPVKEKKEEVEDKP